MTTFTAIKACSICMEFLEHVWKCCLADCLYLGSCACPSRALIVHTNKQPGIHIFPSETGIVPQGWTEYCLPASKVSGRPSAPLLDQAHPWRQSGLLSLLWSLPRPHLELSRKGGLAHWKRIRNSSADWKTLVVIWVAVCQDWSISHATGAGSNSERCPPHGPELHLTFPHHLPNISQQGIP